jgi:hypothetical protein
MDIAISNVRASSILRIWIFVKFVLHSGEGPREITCKTQGRQWRTVG